MASADAPTPLITAETLRYINQQKIESQAEYARQKVLVDSLLALSEEERIQALPTATQDTLLSSWLEQRSLAEQRLLALEKDFGPQHTEVQKAKILIQDANEKIKKRVTGIMLALQSRVDSLKNYIDAITTKVEEAEQADIEKANTSRPYWDAKRELNNQQRLGQLLEMRIATEEIDRDLPKDVMVRITDRAVAGSAPVKPNKTLNIAWASLSAWSSELAWRSSSSISTRA